MVSNSCNAFPEPTKVDIQEAALKGIVRVIGKTSDLKPPYAIYNIGCSKLMNFIHTLEDTIGKKANLEMYPMQQGDVYQTYADTMALENEFGYCSKMILKGGIKRFVEWYNRYSNII